MLDQILQDKRTEIAQLDAHLLRTICPSTRDLRYALGTGWDPLSLFVEIKRRDPREGEMRPDLGLSDLAMQLQELGVDALVVATESRYWHGRRDDLAALKRQGMQVPLVRHDFIVDELQIYDSRPQGADSLFLHPTLRPGERLPSALRIARSMHVVAIVMVTNAVELDAALAADPIAFLAELAAS